MLKDIINFLSRLLLEAAANFGGGMGLATFLLACFSVHFELNLTFDQVGLIIFASGFFWMIFGTAFDWKHQFDD